MRSTPGWKQLQRTNDIAYSRLRQWRRGKKRFYDNDTRSGIFCLSKLSPSSLVRVSPFPFVWKHFKSHLGLKNLTGGIVVRRIVRRMKVTTQFSKNLEPPNIIYIPFDWHSICFINRIYFKVLFQWSFLNPRTVLFSPMLCLSLC